MLWWGKFFNDNAKFLYTVLNKDITFDNSSTVDLLGIKFTPLCDSVTEMVIRMIETGLLPEYRPKPAEINVFTK